MARRDICRLLYGRDRQRCYACQFVWTRDQMWSPNSCHLWRHLLKLVFYEFGSMAVEAQPRVIILENYPRYPFWSSDSLSLGIWFAALRASPLTPTFLLTGPASLHNSISSPTTSWFPVNSSSSGSAISSRAIRSTVACGPLASRSFMPDGMRTMDSSSTTRTRPVIMGGGRRRALAPTMRLHRPSWSKIIRTTSTWRRRQGWRSKCWARRWIARH